MVTLGLVLARIGESDCEELGDWFLVQPVNALTSLAYVVVGLTIAILASRRASRPVDSYVYAVCVAGVGLGSVAFHGPQPDGSRVMHDLLILITVILIVLWDLRVLAPSFHPVLPTFAVAAPAATLLSVASVDAAAVATGLMLACVAVEEVLIFRRGLRPSGDPTHRYAAWAIIGIAVFAGGSWLLGRTGSPVCDPDGVVQFHGLWHLLSSVVFGLWWWLAMAKWAPAEADDPEPRPVNADR